MSGRSRRMARWLAIAGTVFLTSSVLGMTPRPVSATGTGPAFRSSAVIGGGFISVVAQAADGTLVAGGDTEGIFRSINSGSTWTQQAAGLPTWGRHVAAVLSVGSTWYAAVGDGITGGGIAESTDDGVTWTVSANAGAGSAPFFDGSNLPGERGHPRATGNLLATDGTYLYAASFGDGLERWALSSSSLASGWQCIALCTSYLNSLALDGSGDAYVSVIAQTGASDGVDEVTGLNTTPATKLVSAAKGVSTGVQELVSLGTRLYTAGTSGIGYWTGKKWVVLDSTKHWYTVTGYEVTPGSSPVDVLYAAAYTGHGSNDVEQLVVRGTAVVITGLVPNGSVGTTVDGTASPWWEATSAGRAGSDVGPESMIGGCPSSSSPLCSGNTSDFFVGSSIAMLTRNGGAPDSLIVAGRSGVWLYDPSSSPSWQPGVTGLASTWDYSIAVDPSNPANVAAADADWNVLTSTDGMNDVDDSVVPPAFASTNPTGLAVAWDASVSPSALIVSGGNGATNANGSIWYDASWATGGAWSAFTLPTGVATRPIALATDPIAPGIDVMAAAFENKGVYAFTGSGTSGTWALIPKGSGGPTISPNDLHGTSLAWASDGSALFMYDEGTHAVWRSAFNGATFATWSKLYADTLPSPGRGYVAGDPATPSVVWVSNTRGIGSIDTAACTSACTPAWVTTSPGGPVATYANASGDYVYMAGGGTAPVFWEVQVTGCAVSCPSATGFTDPYYAEVANNVLSMAAGADGSVYLALQGNGIAVATAP
jgi:hypothetical protein